MKLILSSILISVAFAQLDLYVATNGSDSNPGTSPAAAVRSITKARDILRGKRPLPNGGAVVHIFPGVYVGESPIQLTDYDSGASPESPVVFKAVDAQGPTKVSGGVPIPASAWGSCTSRVLQNSALQHAGVKLPAEAKCASLAKLGVSKTQVGYFLSGSLHDCQHNKAILSYSSAWMPLARYPNIAANGSWMFSHADGGSSAWFNTSDSRPLNWAKENDPWIHGYVSVDWADEYEKISAISPLPSGGALVNISSSTRPAGWKKHARYIGINLLSELDAPGEWYVDTADPELTLYFYPPSQSDLERFDGNSEEQRAAAPKLAGLRGVSGRAMNDGAYFGVSANVFELGPGTSNVRFEGLVLESSMGSGVNCTQGNCSNIGVTNVVASLHGRKGISIEGSRGTVIDSSETYGVGCSGVAVSGPAADFDTLTPSGIVVRNTSAHQMGRWKRTYMPGIHWGGVGVTLENNHVFNGPHQGILGGGNEIPGVSAVVRGNVIEDLSWEVSDSGAFYTCGQKGEAFINPNSSLVGNTFRRIYNTEPVALGYPSVQAIYLDDEMSWWTIENNTFIDCNKGVFIGGGRNTTVKGNYFALNRTKAVAIHIDDRGLGWQKASCRGEDNQTLAEQASKPAWRSAFPFLSGVLDDRYCTPVHNKLLDNTMCSDGAQGQSLTDFSSKDAQEWGVVEEGNTNGCRP